MKFKIITAQISIHFQNSRVVFDGAVQTVFSGDIRHLPIIVIVVSVVLLAVGQFVLSGTTPVELRSSDLPKEPMLRKRSPTLDDRQHCRNQIVTSERLSELRQQMNRFGVQAYIIPSDNAHQVILSFVTTSDLLP